MSVAEKLAAPGAATPGVTTPERAAETAARLRMVLSLRLQEAASLLQTLASDVADGSWAAQGGASRSGDGLPADLLPDLRAMRACLAAYERAATEGTAKVVRIPIEHACAAKDVLGERNEHTVLVGMRVRWSSSVDEGGEMLPHEGEVIGLHDDEAAIAALTVWRGGWGTHPRGIRVMRIAELRAG